MYTTLALLKSSDACVPGYGRMISFFGTAAAIKDQKIPLHVVALVGGADDCSWALHNGVIIEEKEFKEFYRRNLPSALRCLLSSNGYSNRIRESNSEYAKKPLLLDLLNEAKKVETFEECEAFLNKLRYQRHGNWLFSEIMDHDMFRNPFSFIVYCLESVEKTYSSNSVWAFRGIQTASTSNTDNSTNDDEYDGEDDDGEDDDNDEDDHRSSRSRARPARRAEPVTQKYWFPHSSASATKGQNVARLFTDTPYDFVGELKFKMPKGVTIKIVNGEPTMVTEVKEKKNMFDVIRTMTNKTDTDLDQQD